MSKDNMLLGYARGKVGSLVFARRKGLQITRAYNANPANPKTPAQINQRMKMYAPTNLYKRIRSRFFPFAYEDQRPNETAYNAFMRHNINVSPWVARPLASAYAPVPFRAVMSEGSIPSVLGEWRSAFKSGGATAFGYYIPVTGEADVVARLSQSMIASFPFLQYGDKVTFVAFKSEGLSVEDGNVLYDGVGSFEFKYAQVVLSSSDMSRLGELGFDESYAEQEIAGPPTLVGLSYGATEQDGVSLGACIIVTRQDGSKVLVSSSVMELNDYAANTILSTMSGVLYRDEFASPSYRVSEPDYLNPSKDI